MSTISPLARESAEKLFSYLENRDWRKEDKLMHLKTFWEHFQGFMEQIQELDKIRAAQLFAHANETQLENEKLHSEVMKLVHLAEAGWKDRDALAAKVEDLKAQIQSDNQLRSSLHDARTQFIEKQAAEIERLKEECKLLSSYGGTIRDRLTAERDEADRRAGAAERALEFAQQDFSKTLERKRAVAKTVWATHEQQFAEQEKKLAELREDKARLDWLFSEEGFCIITTATAKELHGKSVTIFHKPAHDLRPAIDAARVLRKQSR